VIIISEAALSNHLSSECYKYMQFFCSFDNNWKRFLGDTRDRAMRRFLPCPWGPHATTGEGSISDFRTAPSFAKVKS